MKRYFTCFIVLYLFLSLPLAALSSLLLEEGMITKVSKDRIEINWGTEDGIVVGIKMNVFRKVDIIHPVTKEKFGLGKDIIGQIEITNASSSNSIGEIVSSVKFFQPGDLVEIAFIESDIAEQGILMQKGIVINVQGNNVNFDLGRDDGVEPGLIFDIYRQVVSRIHPSTGELIAGEKSIVGKVSIISVDKNGSTGNIVSSIGEIQVGDLMELSDFQRGDLEAENKMMETMAQQRPQDMVRAAETTPVDIETLNEQIVRGVVTKVNKDEVFFLWDNGFQLETGKRMGIYRSEEITHPISKKEIGTKLILIARVELVQSTEHGGKGRILSKDANVKWKDLIGLLSTESPAQRTTMTTPPKTEERKQQPQTPDTKVKEAQTLASEINQIQKEIRYLRNLSGKINRIEKSMAEQKKVTENLEKTVNLILDAVAPELKEGQELTLVPSKASMEVYQRPGTKENTMRIKYTDDIDVKFQVANKTLYVTMDADTPSIRDASLVEGQTTDPGMEGQQPAALGDDAVQTTQEGTPEEMGSQPAPFYKNPIILIGVAGGLLLIAAALFFLTKMKKGKSKALPEEEDEETMEGEDEEELSEEEEEMAEDEEEVFDEELE